MNGIGGGSGMSRGMALLLLLAGTARAQEEVRVPSDIQGIFDGRCFSCHDGDTQKGKVRLDQLPALPLKERLDLLNRAQEQVFSGEMPPQKKGPLKAEARAALLAWLGGELAKHKASTLEDKLRYYRYGNYVDHGGLFDGSNQDAPFTPARRWRINELIYHELVNEVFGLKGKERRESFYGVVKPFNLPSESGVKYYDHESVEGGEFLTLLSNAKWVVDKQLRAALLKSGDLRLPQELLDAQAAKKGGSVYRSYPDEAWNPRSTPAEFERVIAAKGAATEAGLKAAVARQFRLALQRDPSPEEYARYLGFFREGSSAGGHVRALKSMMVSVLMEPEFVYRSEFGGGTADAQGRRMLTPRELSYAIAYALTDRVPDESLAKAAQEGRLATRDDVRREVLRLLEASDLEKPRLLRFFQDYFGYYNVFNVFKDEERFGGAYNPHRVVSTKFHNRVPGKVSAEADQVVLSVLKTDKDVLKQLLTTDRFFVHHNGNNAEMLRKAEQELEFERKAREATVLLKDKKKDEDFAAVAKKLDFFVGKDGTAQVGPIRNRMAGFRLLYGEDGRLNADRRPMPKDGEHTDHSVKMYNLDNLTWSYEPVQPLRLEHRMGLLTHPAWLVSFSQNAHTDPVRRGKWIREKLLAGNIQDVPITVDARIPEDPHRTLRERLSVTEAKDCSSCHRKMNPLGNAFEGFDDFGRYRTQEQLEYPENLTKHVEVVADDTNGVLRKLKIPVYKTKAVDARGVLEGTGDKNLDGDVKDAFDLIGRLARSERVRQSFVRNVFRYFMGRNERFTDSRTLVAADKAYVESGGSFKALVVSLLTSDSFLYRK